MSYYLTVDVGSFQKHVFEIDDPTRATTAFNILHGALTPPGNNPYPSSVIVSLNDTERATFRRVDICGVSLVKSRLNR